MTEGHHLGTLRTPHKLVVQFLLNPIDLYLIYPSQVTLQVYIYLPLGSDSPSHPPLLQPTLCDDFLELPRRPSCCGQRRREAAAQKRTADHQAPPGRTHQGRPNNHGEVVKTWMAKCWLNDAERMVRLVNDG